MGLNVDDSYADLLSDNSQNNDEIFDYLWHSNKRISKSVPSSARLKTTKSNDNLFGITEEDSEEDIMLHNKPTATSTPLFSNDEEIVGTDDEDLGFDPKKPKANAGKLGLFDDILPVGTSLGNTKRTTSTPTPSARRSVNREERRPAISRQSTDTTTDNSNTQRPKTSTGRRGSSLSTAINPDPLGLFNNPTAKDPNISNQISTRKRGNTADWLGLNAVDTDDDPGTPHTVDTLVESPKSPRVSSVKPKQDGIQRNGFDIFKINENLDSKEANTFNVVASDEVQNAISATTAQNILQLNAMNLETRNAFALLQQQEPQLSLATQMKQQERVLVHMQRKQDEMLQQQERQFQTLLQQQLQRHQNLEESIKLQQQRINAHIQLMMSQPVAALDALSVPVAGPTHMETGAGDRNQNQNQANGALLTGRSEPQTGTEQQAAKDLIQIETETRRLELEKQRLEELVANIQAKYEREIEMIETTHKKQLEVLDEHTAALETRLREEITEITDHYKEKLKTLEDEHQKSKENWESQIISLRQEHEDELRRVRSMNDENLDILSEEHKRVLESIQRSKMLEFAIVQDNNNYLDTLKAASANLTEATCGIQDLREHLCSKLELANKEKQEELVARERRIADKERMLELSEESTKQEKERLMKLVGTLEQKLSTISKESSEENWQLRLKLSAFEADKIAFEREQEYVREQLQRDEKRLTDIRERQIAEIEKMNLDLQNERRQFQMEKIKFTTEQKFRLNNNSIDRERCEMETAIKCAQDATRQADDERQRYITLQQDLEQRKRELINSESSLRAKQEKLNAELKACYAAKQQSQDAVQRARFIEQNYQEKLQALQSRLRDLAEKESFVAEERKLLAQQRIAIIESQTQTKNGNRIVENMNNAIGNPELKNVVHKLNAIEEAQKRQDNRPSLNVVDRLLDDNIAESMQRMRLRTPPSKPIVNWTNDTSPKYLNAWPQMGLDDDSKSLVLNSNCDILDFDLQGKDVTEL